MGRKVSRKIKSGTTVPTAFRLDRALAQWLDAKARRLTDETGLPATRSHVIRIILKRAMEADKAAK